MNDMPRLTLINMKDLQAALKIAISWSSACHYQSMYSISSQPTFMCCLVLLGNIKMDLPFVFLNSEEAQVFEIIPHWW